MTGDSQGAPGGEGERVLAALRGLPGGEQLLEVARERAGLHLVGGAVRDLLLGRDPLELDVVVIGAIDPVVDELRARLGSTAEVVSFDRFGTASVIGAGGARIDLARARRETYAAPGALPDVVPAASLDEDLGRRDFSVNAIAVALAAGAERPAGAVVAVAGALDDLATGKLRVLHDASFEDDPTRLLRLARYRARLGFDVEPRTAELAERAVAGRALGRVSGARIGAELRLALCEPGGPVETIDALEELDLLAALHLALAARAAGGGGYDRATIERALALLPPDGRSDLVALAALARGFDDRDAMRAWLDELEFAARDRDTAVAAAFDAQPLAATLAETERPSALHAALRDREPETVALAGAVGAAEAAQRARRWLEQLRHVRLRIGGDDLLAAGLAPGPEIGRRLDAALARKLDGELADDREAELAAALAA